MYFVSLNLFVTFGDYWVIDWLGQAAICNLQSTSVHPILNLIKLIPK